MNDELETRLKNKLSASEIKRQALALALVAYDNPDDVYYSLAVNNVLLEEALDLIKRMSTRIEEERHISDMAKIFIKQIEPDIKRGRKVLQGARAGNVATHGNSESKAIRWEKYKDDCISVATDHPYWNLKMIRGRVAINHGVSVKTIARNTPNLRKAIDKLKK